MTEDKLANDYNIIFEDIIENVFITLSAAYLLDNKRPTFDKVMLIAGITTFYWIFIYTIFRPLYRY